MSTTINFEKAIKYIKSLPTTPDSKDARPVYGHRKRTKI